MHIGMLIVLFASSMFVVRAGLGEEYHRMIRKRKAGSVIGLIPEAQEMVNGMTKMATDTIVDAIV